MLPPHVPFRMDTVFKLATIAEEGVNIESFVDRSGIHNMVIRWGRLLLLHDGAVWLTREPSVLPCAQRGKGSMLTIMGQSSRTSTTHGSEFLLHVWVFRRGAMDGMRAV